MDLEPPCEKFKRDQEASEKEMARMREFERELERRKKADIKETEERRHRELIESMKNNTGIHIASGRDIHISGSNVAGRDLKEEINTNQSPNNPEKKWVDKPMGRLIIGIAIGLALVIVTALLRHFYPQWFP